MSTKTLAAAMASPMIFDDPRRDKLQERTREAKVRYLMAFDAERSGREKEPEWLQARRASAISHFEHSGFPTTRDEDWKYVDYTAVANMICDPEFGKSSKSTSANGASEFFLEDKNALRIVFLNGHLAPELSTLDNLPNGLSLSGVHDAIQARNPVLQAHLGRYTSAEDNAFVALNTALFHDGVYIHVKENVQVDAPIHLLFINTIPLSVAQVRNLIIFEDGAKASLVESYASFTDDTYLTNVVTEVVAGEGVALDHYKEQLESDAAYHIATTQIQASDNAIVKSHTFTFGAAISRHNAVAVMDGEHIEVTLNGLYLARGSQKMDNQTIMDHAKPNCRSFEEYAGILDDKAVGAFNGKIFVRKDAQKTDAIQSNRALLLSRDAEVNTKPQLEIFADDVKCTHGATVGELDAESLFYLQSRGVDKETAHKILVQAFAQTVLNNVGIDSLREQLEKQLLQRLH